MYVHLDECCWTHAFTLGVWVYVLIIIYAYIHMNVVEHTVYTMRMYIRIHVGV